MTIIGCLLALLMAAGIAIYVAATIYGWFAKAAARRSQKSLEFVERDPSTWPQYCAMERAPLRFYLGPLALAARRLRRLGLEDIGGMASTTPELTLYSRHFYSPEHKVHATLLSIVGWPSVSFTSRFGRKGILHTSAVSAKQRTRAGGTLVTRGVEGRIEARLRQHEAQLRELRKRHGQPAADGTIEERIQIDRDYNLRFYGKTGK